MYLSKLFPLLCPSPVDVYLLTETVKCLINEELEEMLNKGLMASLKVLGLPQPLNEGAYKGRGEVHKFNTSIGGLRRSVPFPKAAIKMSHGLDFEPQRYNKIHLLQDMNLRAPKFMPSGI